MKHTTSPILQLYCAQGEIDAAFRLYRRMRTTSRVKMDAGTYADFIAAVAAHGHFRPEAPCIVGAEELGYAQACGYVSMRLCLFVFLFLPASVSLPRSADGGHRR